MKTCSKCQIEKELERFSKDKNRKDGRYLHCKECVNNFERQRRLDNPEYRKEYRKQHNKEYYIANKECFNQRRKQWREANLEHDKERKKQYAKNNPEIFRAISRKRRAMKLDVSENFTKQDELTVRDLFNNECYKCSSTTDLCIDHHMPLSKGFALSLSNAVLLCGSCNSSKRDKLPEEFYNEIDLQALDFYFLRYDIKETNNDPS